MDKVGFAYGARVVLSDLSLAVGTGEVLLVVGPSGAGKTTLLGVMAGLLEQGEGTVFLADGTSPRPGGVGYAFQRPEDQLFAATVLEDVAFGPRQLGKGRVRASEVARAAMERVGLDPAVFADRSPFALSGGQARRAALAGVLVLDAPLYVFDEPTAGLDAHGIADLAALVRDLAALGAGVCVVSHDVERLLPLVDRVVVLGGGRVAAELAPGACLPVEVASAAGLGLTSTQRFVQALERRLAAEEPRGGAR